ncbi:MAG TPA: hypothetical protein VK254_01370 [Candidatus Bathyarchaeia archaeon]|nr:hypothetical protein [Candidatus Bathyarchaeia archaeon]
MDLEKISLLRRYGREKQIRKFFAEKLAEEPYAEHIIRAYLVCPSHGKKDLAALLKTPLEVIFEHVCGEEKCETCAALLENSKKVLKYFCDPIKRNGRTVWIPKWRLEASDAARYLVNHRRPWAIIF